MTAGKGLDSLVVKGLMSQTCDALSSLMMSPTQRTTKRRSESFESFNKGGRGVKKKDKSWS